MNGMGYAVMGTASATGQDRAVEAAQRAIASPLLEAGAIDGARGILINVTGSSNLRLAEVNDASTIIQSAAHEDANIIFGAVLDEKMKDEVKITVIATGFKEHGVRRHDRVVGSASNAISQSRTASTYNPPIYTPPPDLPPAVATAPEPVQMPEPPRAERAVAAAAAMAAPIPHREPRTLDDVTSTAKGKFEQDDLDVPAFLRKKQ
jgi:cell division protein FtsZ